jgi:hypothetical protein
LRRKPGKKSAESLTSPPRGSEGRVETSARSESEGQGHRVPAFDLFDPAKDYGKFFLSEAEYAALMKAREERKISARSIPFPRRRDSH